MNVQTLKGFRDFLPQEARKRQYVIDTLKKVFASYGFEPLETPVLEYEEVLTGKYGEEGDKLMYRFLDNGERKVAMRYDQTVPTARVVAKYQNELPMPFKRYQMQNVWRAENTQKGRYREFMQCDIDTIGTDNLFADAEIIACTLAAYRALGFSDVTLLVNDRSVFKDLPIEAIIAIDKLGKIGEDGVIKELVAKGVCKKEDEAQKLLASIVERKPTEALQTIFDYLTKMNVNYTFSPTLARGLDYYTGMIFELTIPEYPVGSVCGGGRYDNLIGMFAGKKIPAVGCAFGFDRTIEAMEELQLFPQELITTKSLVTVFSPALFDKSLEIANTLRIKGVNTEIFPDAQAKMEKQLKYADQKGIPFALILGPEELEKNVVTLKDLQNRTQVQLPLEEIIKKLQ